METPKTHNSIEKQEEKKKDISSLLNDAESIYKSWKQADETYNKNGITNIDTRKKYLYFKEKWENIKKEYDNIINLSSSERNKLIEKIENMKKENRKYESIGTIANIFYYLKQENKDGKLDKVLQKLSIAKNIEEITKNPKKIQLLLKTLETKTGKTPEGENEYNYIISTKNTNLSENEKKLYAMLDPIKNFYNYSEEGGVKLDLHKDDKIFKKELENFEELEKKYNLENKNSNNKNEKTQESYNQINNSDLENYIKLENGVYNSESSIITIRNDTGVKIIKVPEYDKKILKENNIENYLKIYENFEKAGITKLIQFLPQISSAIGGNINYNDDFLKENELKKVLNSILISTGYEKIDDKKDLDEFINIFSNYKNKKQYGGYKDNFYKIGNSTIEEKFLEKFVNNKVKFETELFKKLIKTQKNPT